MLESHQQQGVALDIEFTQYAFYEFALFWWFVAIGGLIFIAAVTGLITKRGHFEPMVMFIILGAIAIPGVGCLAADTKSDSKTEAGALEAIREEALSVYGVDMSLDEVVELCGQRSSGGVAYLKRGISPSDLLEPSTQFQLFGTTTLEIDGKVTEVTLAAQDGEVRLFAGKNELSELPKTD